MVLWPIGIALVAAWAVFHDPAFDYRLIAVGVLLPLFVDAPVARLGIGHSLLLAVTVLVAVMLATRRRRRLRRHAIAVPIGMFLGLVASGAWSQRAVLWWPAFGRHVSHHALLPPIAIVVIEEVIGAAAIIWFARRFELTEADNRRTLLRTGRLSAAGDRRAP